MTHAFSYGETAATFYGTEYYIELRRTPSSLLVEKTRDGVVTEKREIFELRDSRLHKDLSVIGTAFDDHFFLCVWEAAIHEKRLFERAVGYVIEKPCPEHHTRLGVTFLCVNPAASS